MQSELIHKLKRPFHPSKISWRIGARTKDKKKGIALAYIDARDVMQRLDEALGLDWQCKYDIATESGLLVCSIGIKVGGDWIWRSNGAGDTQVEAEKGKASDAFKRAAVLFGIGRYLYSIEGPWVELDDYGNMPRDFKAPALPAWATPEGYDVIIANRKEKSE